MELKAKYNTCKVFTGNIDNETISQLINLLNQPFIEDEKIRIMPDCHAGKGCVIGTTMTLDHNRVVPDLVGVDIGCGMRAIKLKEKNIDLPAFDSVVKKYVPAGFEIHEEAIASSNADKILAPVNVDRAMKSLGTLGGGNHFIELDKDEEDNIWLVIHTGSRHLGIEVCDYYQELAYKKLTENVNGGSEKELVKAAIAKLKSKGRDKEISKEISRIKKEYKENHPDIPYELAYVYDDAIDRPDLDEYCHNFSDYIHDMKLAQEHARINRETIAREILKHAKLHEAESFDTIHNYIDTKNMILRKGAISAQKGERMLIPMNMRDGSLICIGKGNPDWNYSAPHGAGRVLSRSKAKEIISMDDFKASMDGIYSTTVNRSTLDESPFAYKPMVEIMKNIIETVDIVSVIKPIYNFKASE